jgi:hypothetical protein
MVMRRPRRTRQTASLVKQRPKLPQNLKSTCASASLLFVHLQHSLPGITDEPLSLLPALSLTSRGSTTQPILTHSLLVTTLQASPSNQCSDSSISPNNTIVSRLASAVKAFRIRSFISGSLHTGAPPGTLASTAAARCSHNIDVDTSLL